MCTTIAERVPVAGSAKGVGGWVRVTDAYVGYDHPFHAPFDHALMLDFVDADGGPGARVAVEVSRESARVLAQRILDVLERADAYEEGDAAG